MNQLFEKILTFIIFASFLLISYLIFNINEVEYKVKEKRIIKEDVIAEMQAPEWLRKFSICDTFSTYKNKGYGITKCKSGKETFFFKDHDEEYSLDKEYLYIFNKEKMSIVILANVEDKSIESVERLVADIQFDFLHFLGVDYEAMPNNGNYGHIENNKKSAQFLMIKK